jgi:urea transport system ATP-binding protein
VDPLIATKMLRAGYATGDVLQDVSVEVGRGEVVGVLGRNGVGKSTLMRALIGLLPARSGSIVYCGNDITRQPANRRAALGIGYVPQGREVFAQMSVLDNLRMGQFIKRQRDFSPGEVYGYFPFLQGRSRQHAERRPAGDAGDCPRASRWTRPPAARRTERRRTAQHRS